MQLPRILPSSESPPHLLRLGRGFLIPVLLGRESPLCHSGLIQSLTLGVQKFSQAQLLLGGVEGLLEVVDRVGFGQLLEVNDIRPGEETEEFLRCWACPGWD